jgi:hypothetical protein
MIISNYRVTEENEDLLPFTPIFVGDRILIDNTALEHFTVCSRLAEYYLIDRREPAETKPALAYGTAIHSCMELLNANLGIRDRSSEFTWYMQKFDELLTDHFQRFPPPEDEWRNKERAMETMAAYLSQFPDEPYDILPFQGAKAIEISFQLELGKIECGIPLPNGERPDYLYVDWCGRRDLDILRQYKKWVHDYKTTSMLGENFWADFLNSSQQLGYVWAAQEQHGFEFEGTLITAIASRKPSKTGTAQEFERRYFPYEQSRIEEWRHNTLTLVADFISHWERREFPMETKWCVGKYGRCRYLDVCCQPPELRQTYLASNTFKNVTWNPVTREA